MFISYYTIIYFFVKNFFFERLYFSEYNIRMFLFTFWLRNRPSIKYVRKTRGMEKGHPKCLQMRTEKRGITLHVHQGRLKLR